MKRRTWCQFVCSLLGHHYAPFHEETDWYVMTGWKCPFCKWMRVSIRFSEELDDIERLRLRSIGEQLEAKYDGQFRII